MSEKDHLEIIHAINNIMVGMEVNDCVSALSNMVANTIYQHVVKSYRQEALDGMIKHIKAMIEIMEEKENVE